jgi:hypothetical protein
MQNIPNIIAFGEAYIKRQCQLFPEYQENLSFVYPLSLVRWLKFEEEVKRPSTSRQIAERPGCEINGYEGENDTPKLLDY